MNNVTGGFLGLIKELTWTKTSELFVERNFNLNELIINRLIENFAEHCEFQHTPSVLTGNYFARVE